MRKILVVIVAALTAGCAAQSGIVDMGGGRYFVSRQAATGFPGMGNLRAEALGEAAQTCRAQNKAVVIVEEHQTQPPYLLGNYPRIDLTFRCE